MRRTQLAIRRELLRNNFEKALDKPRDQDDTKEVLKSLVAIQAAGQRIYEHLAETDRAQDRFTATVVAITSVVASGLTILVSLLLSAT